MFPPSYTKPALDIPAQLFLLESRGLGIEDLAFARRTLENVSYYRFSAYLYPFRRKDGSDGFIPGTTFNQCGRASIPVAAAVLHAACGVSLHPPYFHGHPGRLRKLGHLEVTRAHLSFASPSPGACF